MAQLCIDIIEQYTQYVAGAYKPKNPIYLEREFFRCGDVIDEYENSMQ